MNIAGNAFLGGDLELALVNGFIPSAADTFEILQASLNIFSEFDNVANGQRLATSDGLGSFVVTYGPGGIFNLDLVVLSAFLQAGLLPGDYNDDGTVDAADYVVWRKNEGTTNALPNDPIGGTVGTAHYNQWRTHFGQTAGSGSGVSANAAVPEPATLVLIILAAAGWCLRRRRTA